ncbi:hypothetical protein PUN4_100021 [Paraburkholderia unamae]|nr:hypothetical protein PUN4_100021 [Paraburkholderia unamae]
MAGIFFGRDETNAPVSAGQTIGPNLVFFPIAESILRT